MMMIHDGTDNGISKNASNVIETFNGAIGSHRSSLMALFHSWLPQKLQSWKVSCQAPLPAELGEGGFFLPLCKLFYPVYTPLLLTLKLSLGINLNTWEAGEMFVASLHCHCQTKEGNFLATFNTFTTTQFLATFNTRMLLAKTLSSRWPHCNLSVPAFICFTTLSFTTFIAAKKTALGKVLVSLNGEPRWNCVISCHPAKHYKDLQPTLPTRSSWNVTLQWLCQPIPLMTAVNTVTAPLLYSCTCVFS